MDHLKKPRKVCYVAGREESYSRTMMIIRSLRAAGYEVATCLPPNRSFKNYPSVILQFLRKKRDCDLVIIGFYGQLLLPLVWLLTRKPILFDIYITTFGTMIHDRNKADANSFIAKLFWLSDYISMTLAKRIIIESRHHIREYARMFGIPEEKFRHIFLATDPSLLYPKENGESNGEFLVHFHGEYAPFHGVKHILHAADILRGENIHFQIIGTGITYDEDMQLAESLKLDNCRFIDRVPFAELADYMSRADCCLGFFGDNPRTMRVFTNKVVEALAVGKPLISTKNEPIQELLTDGESALLVERGNPPAIAEAVLRLRNDERLRERISKKGHRKFQENCTLDVFSGQLKKVIEEMLN